VFNLLLGIVLFIYMIYIARSRVYMMECGKNKSKTKPASSAWSLRTMDLVNGLRCHMATVSLDLSDSISLRCIMTRTADKSARPLSSFADSYFGSQRSTFVVGKCKLSNIRLKRKHTITISIH